LDSTFKEYCYRILILHTLGHVTSRCDEEDIRSLEILSQTGIDGRCKKSHKEHVSCLLLLFTVFFTVACTKTRGANAQSACLSFILSCTMFNKGNYTQQLQQHLRIRTFFIPEPGSWILHEKSDENKNYLFSCSLWFQELVLIIKKIINPVSGNILPRIQGVKSTGSRG
jgi:hypothetical protein